MKKIIIFILAFAVFLTLFTACSDKDESDSAVSTTKLGEVAISYSMKSDEGKTIVYETDKKQTVKLDIYDENGDLQYTEEYLYDAYGAVYGYTYYNAERAFVASYLFAGEKTGYFFENGSPMSEHEFAQKMDAIGAAGS